ncbi:hypothetical protein AG0111_0g7650 [Alternaria gaisen]|uniref:Uncharacterized protein n=1 Tax=Alternaria gaisen TaxID=167740 RepID=A0ACB6FHE1_9PLEO|nr:hypothetical protein AG0111_0g7650 [Alternaria gaisen]
MQPHGYITHTGRSVEDWDPVNEAIHTPRDELRARLELQDENL